MTTTTTARQAARDAMEGLALGDAFGERWFEPSRVPAEAVARIRARHTPEESPWHWTDDTAMALCVYRALLDQDGINRTQLAAMFGATYLADPARRYGYGMTKLLPRLAEAPERWATETRALFDGQGSLGNGAAMRVAPLGAWFAEDLDEAVEQAVYSAEVTHTHPEGVAGAVAVAVAAALAARSRMPGGGPYGESLLYEVADRTPEGAVRAGIRVAAELPPETEPGRAAALLGNGKRISAADTVPFALWAAAYHLDDLVGGLWTTAEGLGDVDTTCAIAGGVIAAGTGLGGVPAAWRERCEALPQWVAGE
ncbi:ADP-ribosylglycohydrolase family protein [Kitasatospora sp. NA04385]|uniref:ADP-ribosylglycohydrolase family protein n=1 Tax=Kitasatospora sp. NA04385 TaxID=2742135 RepID=UPI0015918E0C|nr:ADP-ribosylglycohydrolase family protein [Kitasatospora sp. NA04385]QKW18426.1 ADP-ribosylglycohydrolase family protein [Kitasatospora sp. NA04385]